MKVLLTGGKGFLGSYIAFFLKNKNYTLVLTDQKELDVRSPEAITQILQKEKPEVVIHLAALCGAAPSRENPYAYFETNLTGTLNLLEAMRLTKTRNLIFTSSLTVFGASDTAVNENSPYQPRHPYAASKAAAEILIQNYCREYEISAVILRPTLVVGENYREPHAIGSFIETARLGHSLTLYGPGSHQRDFIHPEDVAQAVERTCASLVTKPLHHVSSLNLSSGEAPTMKELAKQIASRFPGVSLKYENPTGQTFSLFTKIDLAKRDLNWTPTLPIDSIIDRLIQNPNDNKNTTR